MALRALQGPAGGSAPVGGSGTTNTIPRWTGPSTLGDSLITQSGSFTGVNCGAGLPTQPLHVVGNILATLGSVSGQSIQLAPGNSYGTLSSGSGLILSAAAGTLIDGTFHQFRSAGGASTRMVIDSSGRLLVGTSTAPSSSEIRQLIAPGAGTNGGTQWSAPTSGGFAVTPVATNGGAIFYRHSGAIGSESYVERFNFSSTAIQFKDGANLLASIDNSGNVTLPFGGSTLNVSTTNAGVKLPATPGNADTQTLDCYQEGTWVPTLTGFGGTAPTVDTARFTRVGRLVYFAIRLSATGGANYSGTRTTTYISLPVAPGYAQANALMADNNVNSLGQALIATNFGGVVFLPTFALTVTGTCISGVYEV